jgi:hypothetical protein
MAEEKIEYQELFDPELVPDDFSGNKKVAQMAVDHTVAVFERYRDMRCFMRGGKQIDLTDEWDKNYRIYKGIYLKRDHSYDGNAEVFNPELRKAVNTIESEASNALFGREDYFSVEDRGNTPDSQEMSREAFGTLQYYSDLEDYKYNYELAMKQCLIYGETWVEDVYDRNKVNGIYRQKREEIVLDINTGEPVIGPDGQPVTNITFDMVKVDEDKPTIRVEVRDIYRMYINHLLDDPEKDDIVYRDSLTVQELLEHVERGVYNKKAVEAMISNVPTYGEMTTQDIDGSGEGRTFLDDINTVHKDSESIHYEVLRFQGLFTTKDSNGKRIKRQFWIDIGERGHCLRCIENPIIGGFKTFSGCNYDSMPGEFSSDSVISPYQKLQFQMNDKENQSLDGLTFNLNGPVEVLQGAGVKASDLIAARKQPNKVIFTKVKDSVRKITVDVPLNHLNNEQVRLQSMIQSGTGATSLAAGAPTGTQVDRSGKALGTLLSQTRSQFSKFVRKFEKRMIERSLQKAWDIILQFFDDEILIPVQGSDGTVTSKFQSPSQIIGQYQVSVSTGSQYLKEREYRDSILELLSVAGISDKFMETLDVVPMFQEIARSLSPKLAKFINPDNLINRQSQLIQQLQQALQSVGDQNKVLFEEAKRLQGELKQTDRAAAATPGPIEKRENRQSIQ